MLARSCVAFGEVLHEDIRVLVGKSLADGAKTPHYSGFAFPVMCLELFLD